MDIRQSRSLHVLHLEDRITPAVAAKFSAGVLTITGDDSNTNVLVAELPTPGKFAVTINGNPMGQFVLKGLTVNTGKGNDVVDLRVRTLIAGNVNISLGGGSDQFTTRNLPGPLPLTLPRIGGTVTVDTGAAGLLGVLGGKYDESVELYNLQIMGKVSVTGSAGSAAELLDINNAKLSGALSVTNIYQTAVGSQTSLSSPVTLGSVTVNNLLKNTDSRTDTYVGPGNDLLFFNNVEVYGDVTYTGGSGQDTVELPSDPMTSTPAKIHGNVNANTGEGVGTLSLGNGNGAGAQIDGSVWFTGGCNVDRFFFDSGATVNGDITVYAGDGNNQFFGNSLPALGPVFDPAGSATVFGKLTLIAGNGDNFIATFDAGASLYVGGDLLIDFGDGNATGGTAFLPDSFLTFFNTSLTVGGVATFQAGFGVHNFSITTETITLNLIFAGGDSSLVFDQLSGFIDGDVYIDFGVGGVHQIGGSAAFSTTGTFDAINI